MANDATSKAPQARPTPLQIRWNPNRARSKRADVAKIGSYLVELAPDEGESGPILAMLGPRLDELDLYLVESGPVLVKVGPALAEIGPKYSHFWSFAQYPSLKSSSGRPIRVCSRSQFAFKCAF